MSIGATYYRVYRPSFGYPTPFAFSAKQGMIHYSGCDDSMVMLSGEGGVVGSDLTPSYTVPQESTRIQVQRLPEIPDSEIVIKTAAKILSQALKAQRAGTPLAMAAVLMGNIEVRLLGHKSNLFSPNRDQKQAALDLLERTKRVEIVEGNILPYNQIRRIDDTKDQIARIKDNRTLAALIAEIESVLAGSRLFLNFDIYLVCRGEGDRREAIKVSGDRRFSHFREWREVEKRELFSKFVRNGLSAGSQFMFVPEITRELVNRDGITRGGIIQEHYKNYRLHYGMTPGELAYVSAPIDQGSDSNPYGWVVAKMSEWEPLLFEKENIPDEFIDGFEEHPLFVLDEATGKYVLAISNLERDINFIEEAALRQRFISFVSSYIERQDLLGRNRSFYPAQLRFPKGRYPERAEIGTQYRGRVNVHLEELMRTIAIKVGGVCGDRRDSLKEILDRNEAVSEATRKQEVVNPQTFPAILSLSDLLTDDGLLNPKYRHHFRTPEEYRDLIRKFIDSQGRFLGDERPVPIGGPFLPDVPGVDHYSLVRKSKKIDVERLNLLHSGEFRYRALFDLDFLIQGASLKYGTPCSYDVETYYNRRLLKCNEAVFIRYMGMPISVTAVSKEDVGLGNIKVSKSKFKDARVRYAFIHYIMTLPEFQRLGLIIHSLLEIVTSIWGEMLLDGFFNPTNWIHNPENGLYQPSRLIELVGHSGRYTVADFFWQWIGFAYDNGETVDPASEAVIQAADRRIVSAEERNRNPLRRINSHVFVDPEVYPENVRYPFIGGELGVPEDEKQGRYYGRWREVFSPERGDSLYFAGPVSLDSYLEARFKEAGEVASQDRRRKAEQIAIEFFRSIRKKVIRGAF